MMKPNDFCVNDVKFRCVWGSRTTWDALNEIQKERKDKIVFSGTVEERGEGSRYAFFRDDEQGINYLIPIQESGQQTPENDIFKSAVHWWGKEAQTDMMIEEMAELTKAILNERRGAGSQYRRGNGGRQDHACTNGNHIPERRGSRTEIPGKGRAVRSETAGKTGRGGA